jgi:hypothetical protein
MAYSMFEGIYQGDVLEVDEVLKVRVLKVRVLKVKVLKVRVASS